MKPILNRYRGKTGISPGTFRVFSKEHSRREEWKELVAGDDFFNDQCLNFRECLPSIFAFVSVI